MTEYIVREETAYFGETIELEDNESILDAEYRGANRIVIAIATPVDSVACGVCGHLVECDCGCCGGGGE